MRSKSACPVENRVEVGVVAWDGLRKRQRRMIPIGGRIAANSSQVRVPSHLDRLEFEASDDNGRFWLIRLHVVAFRVVFKALVPLSWSIRSVSAGVPSLRVAK